MTKNSDDRATPSVKQRLSVWGETAVGVVLIGVLELIRLLPYRWRIPFGGWFFARVFAPLAGYRKRIENNLRLTGIDLPSEDIARLVRAVPDNMGRAVLEMFSPRELHKVALQTPFSGPGMDAVEQARAKGQPVIFVSGHFGNYDVIRTGFAARGFPLGGLYRRMNNRVFNERYVAAISTAGSPLFERGRRGMTQMIKHLKDGGSLALLIDQHMGAGAPLSFFGQTAYTAVSAAQMALKYDALVIPCYAIRQADGMSFKVELEAPIAHTTAEDMTQALNDSLERRVRENMGQWLWMHRRWKGAKQPK